MKTTKPSSPNHSNETTKRSPLPLPRERSSQDDGPATSSLSLKDDETVTSWPFKPRTPLSNKFLGNEFVDLFFKRSVPSSSTSSSSTFASTPKLPSKPCPFSSRSATGSSPTRGCKCADRVAMGESAGAYASHRLGRHASGRPQTAIGGHKATGHRHPMDLKTGKKADASLVVHGSTMAAATRARAVAEQMIGGMPENLIDAVAGPKMVLDIELQPVLAVVGIGIRSSIGSGIGIIVGKPIPTVLGIRIDIGVSIVRGQARVGTVATSAARCSRWRVIAPSLRARRHMTLAEALRWCRMDSSGRRQDLWSDCARATDSEEGTSGSLSLLTLVNVHVIKSAMSLFSLCCLRYMVGEKGVVVRPAVFPIEAFSPYFPLHKYEFRLGRMLLTMLVDCVSATGGGFNAYPPVMNNCSADETSMQEWGTWKGLRGEREYWDVDKKLVD
ncbi:hypothetical protein BKA58DRAFT_425126 [Alternaria rosae]|uniref:uncharacterized protein n=1 Tax=Alternaria rosae TaxID=1187941 RepID=UPI001E8D75F0|nr:uncharacterized protein BKA58DRAFT_425126 [Alternaria rosae]KAH6848448.1 hypothetical protein BKA58DRAFT_425126 [Alternaria rosae]